jgi:hypothetical protein
VKVTLEVDPREVEHHRETYPRMLARLCEAFAQRDLAVTFEVSSTRASFAGRIPPSPGFRIAWHSVGEEPRVWRLKDAAVPGYYLFDRRGFSGWAEIGLHPERFAPLIDRIGVNDARAFVAELRRTLAGGNISKLRQPDGTFEAPGPFVFLPLQVLDDTVVALQRLSTLDVLERAGTLARDTRRHLVLKRHPRCANEQVAGAIARAVGRNPYVVQTDASIHAILPACDAVLVANSGVGFEALIHHRPVYAFGRSEYELATRRVETLDDVALAFAPSHEVDFDHVDRYLAYFLGQYCLSPDDMAGILRHLDTAIADAGDPEVPDAMPVQASLQRQLLETSARLETERRRVIALQAKLAASWVLTGRLSRLSTAAWSRIIGRRAGRRQGRAS